MALIEIADLLKNTIGMDPASVGLSAVEHALKERLSACRLDDLEIYWERVRSSKTELQALIEAVVVPETWFFRDPAAFSALTRIAFDEWTSTASEVRRLLSVPSSTGEEPYSMAMALLDAGFPANRFRIDAVDISQRAIARAGRAVYGDNSFRGSGITVRDRHFERTAEGYRLGDAVRRQVTFQQGNVLNASFGAAPNTYDAIFCRNLLIYFDRATQDRTVTILGGLLKAKGVLFVGAAESGVFRDQAFISAQLPMAFAFRRASAPPHKKPRAVSRNGVKPFREIERPVTPPPTARPSPPVRVMPIVSADSEAEIWRSVGNSTSQADQDVGDALRLANQGRFVEAAVCCEEALRRYGPSADAFHLLGLVRDASGNSSEAAAYYRKALYLDPDHHDAVLHLALLMDKEGLTAQARALWNRAKRLSQRVSR